MHPSLLPFICLSWIIIIKVLSDVTCDDSQSVCVIVADDDNDIECNFFQSCDGAYAIQSTSSASIYCDGGHSCYNTSFIQHISLLNSANINCQGLMSCAHVSGYLYNNNGNIYCSGEQSCAYSNIQVYEYLYCYGARSCKNSIIFVGEYAIMSGSLSGANSIFYSNSTLTELSFKGADSGYNATVNCGTGHQCDIFCYHNSCTNMIVQCKDIIIDNTNNDKITNCTINIDCQYAEQSDICPDGYQSSPFWINIGQSSLFSFLPNLIDIGMSNYDNSVILCNLSPKCDGWELYPDCRFQTIDTTDTEFPICCTGEEVCLDSNITALVAPSRNNSAVAARCDGHAACGGTRTTIYTISGLGGSIFLSGAYSVESRFGQDLTIETDNDIVCSGTFACYYIYFSNKGLVNARNVYCTGRGSCMYSRIYNITNNVYCYGFAAGYYSEIDTIWNGSVVCASSCKDANIQNINGNVLGSGYETFHSAFIANVSGSLVGLGHYCLTLSNIYNATNVVCLGQYSCYWTEMEAIHAVIEANGRNALSLANIVSNTNFDQDGILTIHINGTNNQAYNIYCSFGDVCKINCQSSNACTNLILDCNGTCWVDCDPRNGIDCPQMLLTNTTNNNYILWNATMPPTQFPIATTQLRLPTSRTQVSTTNIVTSPPHVHNNTDSSSSTTIATTSFLTTLNKESKTLFLNGNDLNWNGVSLLILCLCISSCLLVMFLCIIHYHTTLEKACDPPNLHSLLCFFVNIGTIGSSIILCIVLIQDNGNNFNKYKFANSEYFSLRYLYCAFVIMPFFVSCIYGLYRIEQWRIRKDSRLLKYIEKYDSLLYGFTVLAGFQSAVELVSSKIFAKKWFNLQIKLMEKQQIQNFMLVAILLLRDIPQLAIQIIYIVDFNGYKNNLTDSSIVLCIAILFTFVSLMISIKQHFKTMKKRCNPENIIIAGTYTKITCDMSIECTDLKSRHCCTHSKIGDCLQSVIIEFLREFEKKENEMGDKNAFTLEVYQIESNISLSNSIDIIFAININRDQCTQTILRMIEKINTKNNGYRQRLKDLLIKSLKLKSSSMNNMSVAVNQDGIHISRNYQHITRNTQVQLSQIVAK